MAGGTVDQLIAAVRGGQLLNPAEEHVARAFHRGQRAKPGRIRALRPSFVRNLLIHADLAEGGHPTQLWIEDARIHDELDLTGMNLDFRILLRSCDLHRLRLTDVRVLALDLEGSSCRGVHADRITVKHGLSAGAGFHAKGRFYLRSARVGGDLNLQGASLDGEHGWASLLVDGARIDGRLYLRSVKHHKFTALNGIHAQGVVVGGNVRCDGAELCQEVNLTRARISGSLMLQSATIGGAFTAQGIQVDGDTSFWKARINGPSLSLRQARVNGSLVWRAVKRQIIPRPTLQIDLRQAHVGYLDDAAQDWREPAAEVRRFRL